MDEIVKKINEFTRLSKERELTEEEKKEREKYNLTDIRLHDFRHSHASLLIHSGINILAISKRLGHEDVKTTLNIYAHLYDSENEKLINKLNELTQN